MLLIVTFELTVMYRPRAILGDTVWDGDLHLDGYFLPGIVPLRSVENERCGGHIVRQPLHHVACPV